MIFVSIASYRDPECKATVVDLFQKAKYPDGINVGIVLQEISGDNLFFEYPRVKIQLVSATDSQGVCWARNRANLLWNNEDYVLQIDSHMRFVTNWDEKLLLQLSMCENEKSILTTYPPNYDAPNLLSGANPSFLAPKQFNENGSLSQQGIPLKPSPIFPKLTALIAAGFIFGKSQWIHDVPYDPLIYFDGEEITLAVRLWTSGWNFFGPIEVVIWHRYGNIGRSLHWTDNKNWHILNTRSLIRMKHLFRMENGSVDDPYGLGTIRTLEQYQQFSGINFVNRTIAPYSLLGDFSNL